MESLLDGAVNFNVLVREWHDQIIFLHKIARGGTDKSYGIHVARLAGLPKPVIARAGVILGELERGFSRELKSPELAEGRPPAGPDLFDQGDRTILEEIQAMDLENLTPMQAIQALADFQKRLKE